MIEYRIDLYVLNRDLGKPIAERGFIFLNYNDFLMKYANLCYKHHRGIRAGVVRLVTSELNLEMRVDDG